ncbi:DNA-binding response regulator [Buttiauxella noackiae]|uniref:DNA-binding response regulator n=1 Tax=Buttiauxella noackiae TaxID=82992 RepID=UPI0035A5F83A
MPENKASLFLRNPFCRAVIISKRPLMREGLQIVMKENATESAQILLADYLDLSSEILDKVDVVMIELDSSQQEFIEQCEYLNHLKSKPRHVRWIFIVPAHLRNIAVERLLTAKTSLLSLHEPMSSIIEHVFNNVGDAERISKYLLQEQVAQPSITDTVKTNLTFSECRVLRLISKGWKLVQIATLLEKNYKTVSAQKKSAMRRLALKTDAEMYAWIFSDRGKRELSIPPYNQGI